MRERFISVVKHRAGPRIIEGTQTNFSDLEHNYCCDSDNMFYEMKHGELEQKRKFESFTELFAKEFQKTSKMVHISDIIASETKKLKIIEEKIRNSGI